MKKLNKHQQLRIIEGLTLSYQNSSETHEQAKKNLSDIYMIAHLNGTCRNNHLDWHEKGFQLINDFRDYGISDIRRTLWEEKLRNLKNDLKTKLRMLRKQFYRILNPEKL